MLPRGLEFVVLPLGRSFGSPLFVLSLALSEPQGASRGFWMRSAPAASALPLTVINTNGGEQFFRNFSASCSHLCTTDFQSVDRRDGLEVRRTALLRPCCGRQFLMPPEGGTTNNTYFVDFLLASNSAIAFFSSSAAGPVAVLAILAAT